MGYIYEELIRRFSEQSNETAGEDFTPREVIRLMVNLLFAEDDALLRDAGVVKTLLDPACGTGGMLAVAAEHLTEMNPKAHLEVFGQELNDESFAICRSDMMLKGQSSANIVSGNSFSADGFIGRTFDYLLAIPPFGVEWKNVEIAVKAEAKSLGFAGRFGAGLQRRISDSPEPAAPLNSGEPLKTIRSRFRCCRRAGPGRATIASSQSFSMILVQLIDARALFVRMRKSLGDKRKEISAPGRDRARFGHVTRFVEPGAWPDGRGR
jgi:type I restriction-modification system DNA methylase subunit